MALKIVGEGKGFERYCPTFSNAFTRFKERMEQRRMNAETKRCVEQLAQDEAGWSAAMHLAKIAEKLFNISAAIPGLVNLLYLRPENESEIRNVEFAKSYATRALLSAAKNGADISAAVPALVSLLDVKGMEKYAALALVNSAIRKNGTRAIWALPLLFGKPNVLKESLRAMGGTLKDATTEGDGASIAVQYIVRLLWDKESSIRHDALEVLMEVATAEGGRENVVNALAKALESNNVYVLKNAVNASIKVIDKLGSQELVVPLAKLLKSENVETEEKRNIILALNGAVVDVSGWKEVIGSLVEILDDPEHEIRCLSLDALHKVAQNRKDVSAAVPKLFGLLREDDEFMRSEAGQVLNIATETGPRETLQPIVACVATFVESDWFGFEAEGNSTKYVIAAKAVADAMENVRKRMDEAA